MNEQTVAVSVQVTGAIATKDPRWRLWRTQGTLKPHWSPGNERCSKPDVHLGARAAG